MTRHLRRPVWRALVLGDGHGAHGPQTGSERQAIALATSLLRIAHGSYHDVESEHFHVHTSSLRAVQHPMPRLFRPLADGAWSRRAMRLFGIMFLASPANIGHRLFPEHLVAGTPLPVQFSENVDGSKTILVAAGSAASAAAVLRRNQSSGVKLVQVLHPRCSLELFDAVVTPAHDFPPGAKIPSNCITSNGSLHGLDSKRLASHFAMNPIKELECMGRPYVTILLGGPRGHRARFLVWNDKNALQLANSISSIVGDTGSVIISVSRRTPYAYAIRLQRVLGSLLGISRVHFDDGTSHSRYLSFLGSSDVIVVTADSVNMLSEALASNAEVFVAGKPFSSRIERFHLQQMERGILRPLPTSGSVAYKAQKSVPQGEASRYQARTITSTKTESFENALEIDRIAAAVWNVLHA